MTTSTFAATVVSILDLASWADAVIALDARGRCRLPTRFVLVPSEAHAHALRVELVARAPHALAGTRFLTVAAVALGWIRRQRAPEGARGGCLTDRFPGHSLTAWTIGR